MMSSYKTKRGEAMAFLDQALLMETDECIIWPFAINGKGYAQVTEKQLHEWRSRTVASKICEQIYGQRPTELHRAVHSCENRACVNKRHCTWGIPSYGEKVAPRVLDQKYLKEILRYDSETEQWTWLVDKGSVIAGTIAGFMGGYGHWIIKIDRKGYRAAHLLCLYLAGKWPEDVDELR
jgi:hypothetical protein